MQSSGQSPAQASDRASARASANDQTQAAQVPHVSEAASPHEEDTGCPRHKDEHEDAHDDLEPGGVRLTGQRFFGGLFILFVAVPLVYLGGFLAGRSALEEELALASDIPKSAVEQPDVSEEASGEPDGKDAARDRARNGRKGEESDDGILKPQELAFSRFLRAAPGEKVSEPKPLQNLPPAVPKDDPAAVPMTPGMSPASATGGPPEKPEQTASLYDFVYQVAAFRTQEDAETARIQIEAEGFRSRLEHNGSLYIVLLLSRGPLSRVNEIMETTTKLRLGTPIERSRKAVLLPIGQR